MRVPSTLTLDDHARFIVRFTCPGLPTLEQSLPFRTLAANQPSPEGLRQLGEWAIEQQAWRKAQNWLTKAYAQKPDNFSIRWSYGRSLAMCAKEFKQPDKQLAIDNILIADTPNYLLRVDVLASFADAYEHKQAWKEAEEWIARIEALEPHSVDVKARRARILVAQGDYEQAQRLWEDAVTAHPDSASVLNGYAWDLAVTWPEKYRNPARAVELARRAVTLSKRQSWQILDTLAEALLVAGRPAEALIENNAARLVSPQQPELAARDKRIRAAIDQLAK